jgi:hypothetical protein
VVGASAAAKGAPEAPPAIDFQFSQQRGSGGVSAGPHLGTYDTKYRRAWFSWSDCFHMRLHPHVGVAPQVRRISAVHRCIYHAVTAVQEIEFVLDTCCIERDC